MTEFVDVFPTELELTNTHLDHVCPEGNCNSVFKKSPHLTMHLVKHHKIGKLGLLTKQCNSRFFCPVNQCIYNKNTSDCKSFSQNRLLKQHYMKVHGPKRYECVRCETKFSIQSIYKRHLNECGNRFYCQVCGWEYNNKGSLVLHLSRKHPDLHRLYKQNKYMLSNTSGGKTSQNLDNLKGNKLPILRNTDSAVISTAFNVVVRDTGQNALILNHSEVNGIHQMCIDLSEENTPVASKELGNKTEVKNEVFHLSERENGATLSLRDADSVKKQISPKITANFSLCLDKNGVSSIKVDKNAIDDACSGVTSYILIPTGNVYPHLSSEADNNAVSTEKLSKTRGRKRVRQALKKISVAKHSKKLCKAKESKKKQLIVHESAMSTDESSVSSFNQDRFTQTTLKTVIKAKDSDTQKFNVETQTSAAGGAKPKHKIKIDKSTNLSYENNKRTFATQTHRSILNKIKKGQPGGQEMIKVYNRNIVDKHQKIKAKRINKSSKESLQNVDLSTKSCTFTNSFNVSMQTDRSETNNFDTKHFTVKKKDSGLQTAMPACLDQINTTVIEKSIAFCDLGAATTPSNFDSSDMSTQFAYRDLMDDKSNAGNSTTIETQTALDELLYSNRWKHDSILFSELICLSDIQTQTTWPSDGKNIENGLHFDDNCMNPESMDSLNASAKYADCENALISTETQTNENIFDFPSKIPLYEENRNESPDFSFKETQTCDCFADSINFDYDFDNLHSDSFSLNNSHSRNCCRGLLNRKSDVLLSCTSSETQTYGMNDPIVSKNLSNDSS